MEKAYIDAIIAASMCLGAAGLLIIGIIVYFSIGIGRSRRAEAIQKERNKEYLELKELQGQLAMKKLKEQGVVFQ